MNVRSTARYIIPLLVPAILALTSACGSDDDEATATLTVSPAVTATTLAVTPTATAAATTPTATPVPTDTPVPTAENVCKTNPDPATDETNVVAFPEPNAQITSPITVAGQIAAFEAAFKMTLYDASGGFISEQTALSNEGQTLAPFEAQIAFDVQKLTPACLWVFAESARDGSPIDVVQVPLILLPPQ